MRSLSVILILSSLFTSFSFAQDAGHKIGFDYGVELYSLFDNTEYAGCKYQDDQTMPGTVLTPELGMNIDGKHHLRAGASVIANWGDNDKIVRVSPVAYYEYNSAPIQFFMGAFPRRGSQTTLPRVMMQDSVLFYRPVVNGFLFKAGGERTFFDMWLDWTGLQSQTRRETFFVGWDGKYSHKILRLSHNGYMFHYAKMKDAPDGQYIHDNIMLVTKAGVDFADLSGLSHLNEFSLMAGWVFGLEDNRGETGWLPHNALLFDVCFDWRGLGVKNSFYYGKGQMNFYDKQSNNLYWGDPVYRANLYNRTDLFANVVNTSFVDVYIDLAFHTFEQGLYLEQCLTAKVDINNFGRKNAEKRRKPIFTDWFAKRSK